MFYPLSIDMEDKKVLIIGGGKIGFHKGSVLAKTGAKITLISPERHPAWDDLLVEWRKECYEDQPLDDYFLVICATDDEALNERVAAVCKEQKILCDNVANGTKGDLIFPAVVRQGGYTVAITSGGQTPFLTKKIKAEVEELLSPYDEETVTLLSKIRSYIIEHYPAEKDALLQKLAQTPLSIIKEKGNPDEISDWLQRE